MYAEITNDSEVFVSLSNRHLLYFSFMLHVIYNFLSVLQMVFLWDTDRRKHLCLEHCQLYGRGKRENGDHLVLKCLLGSDAYCFCSPLIGQAYVNETGEYNFPRGDQQIFLFVKVYI